jgi:hypothetical protein
VTKVVYNACYGGFGISLAAARRMADLGHEEAAKEVAEYDAKVSDPSKQEGLERKYGVRWYGHFTGIDRADPILVQVVEELGLAASGDHARLRIEEIPAGTQYRIDEYDGNESVATRDSYEWKTA